MNRGVSSVTIRGVWAFFSAVALLCAQGGMGVFPPTAGGGGGSTSITRTAAGNQSTSYTFARSTAIHQWSVTLTGNVTFSASGLTSGDMLSFELTQDATGGRTPTLPSGFPGASLVCSTAGSKSTLNYRWDGSAATLYSFGTTGCGTTAISWNSGNITTFPDANRTVATLDGTETLTGKTLTSPVLSNGTNGHCVQKNSSTGVLETSGAACGGGGGSTVWSESTKLARSDPSSSRMSLVSYSSTLALDNGGGTCPRCRITVVFPNTAATPVEEFAVSYYLDSRYTTNGNVTVRMLVLAVASGAISFDVSPRCVVPGAPFDPSWGAAQTITASTVTANNYIEVTGTVTVNCAANNKLEFAVVRNTSDANAGTVYADMIRVHQ